MEPVIEAFSSAAAKGALLGVALSEAVSREYTFNDSAMSSNALVLKGDDSSVQLPTENDANTVDKMKLDVM
jgi:hypothetical protein